MRSVANQSVPRAYDSELLAIEDRIDLFIGNKEELRGLLLDKTVSDFPLLALTDFDQFVTEVQCEELELYSAPVLDYRQSLITLIGRKSEIFSHNVFSMMPLVFSLAYVIIAIVTSNYWLLLGIALVAVAAFSSHTKNPLSKLFGLLGLCLAVYFLVKGQYLNFLLPLGFILLNINYAAYRSNYRKAITDRAQESEKAFLLLLTFGLINVFRKNASGQLRRLQLQ